MSDRTYTPAEAAAIIGLTERTIIKRCLDSRVPGARRTDSGWVIPAASVESERQRVASKTNVKAPDSRSAASQISVTAPTVRRLVNEYTSALGSASEAELETNRRRIAEIASKAKAAIFIGADGRQTKVKRMR